MLSPSFTVYVSKGRVNTSYITISNSSSIRVSFTSSTNVSVNGSNSSGFFSSSINNNTPLIALS